MLTEEPGDPMRCHNKHDRLSYWIENTLHLSQKALHPFVGTTVELLIHD